MSNEWVKDLLGKHSEIRARIGWRGLASSEYTDDGPFLIAGKHIRGGKINWDHCDHITEFRYHESSEIALSIGDVILTKDGTIGRVARVDSLPGAATINGTMMLVRPRSSIDYRFLFHVLNGNEFKKLVADKVSGSSIPHIFQRDMYGLVIGLPSVEEQAAIANVLDVLDTQIEKTQAIIAKLEQAKEGLLHDLLTRGVDENGELRPHPEEAPESYNESALGLVPREWAIEFLDEVALRGSGHTPSKSIAAYWNGGVPWVSLADSHQLDQIYINTTDKEISDLGIAKSSAVKHPAGTVILSRDAGVGRSAVLALEMAVSQHFIAWRCSGRLNNLFLYFKLQHMKPAFEAIALGSTVKTIGLDYFRKLQVSVPARSEQDFAVEVLMSAETDIRKHRAEFAKLRMLKLGLMDDLLTGRVRVTPLLEREPAEAS